MFKSKRLIQIVLVAWLTVLGASIERASAIPHVPRPGQVVNVQVFTSNSIAAQQVPPGTTTPTKLSAPIFTYTKQSDSSILKITYQDQVWNGTGGAVVCRYQLRIDDTPSESGNMFSAPILIVSGGIFGTKFSSVGIFTGLAAGPHEISIWLGGSNTNVSIDCIQNFGGTTTTILVEELEPLVR